MTDVRLAMTGFGNVGKGVAELLRDQTDDYAARYGVRLILSAVADRNSAAVNADGLDPAVLLRTKAETGSVGGESGLREGISRHELLRRSGAHVFIEAATTNFDDAEPGWSTIRAALSQNMDVVLASKGALVLYYTRLMNEARSRGRLVRYSATVGAPLPVLDMFERTLVGARITGFEGILNSTSNEILGAMADGSSYEEGVRLAQQLGIAETDPTLDVDGWDAAAKAAILANTAFGTSLGIGNVERKGIRTIQADQLMTAAGEGATIKLISSAFRDGDQVTAVVRPQARPLSDPLGRLKGGELGIVIHAEPIGHVTSTVENTSGVSGGTLTAMTVLRDVLNLARERGRSSSAG
ncbi:MAG TPA: hypothetical protein VF221_09525 [Chloroflexota bacterium]